MINPIIIFLALFFLQSIAYADNASSLLGVNLEGNADWARSLMFVDAMKSARKFGSPQKPWQGVVKLDSEGWPLEDFGVVVFVGNKKNSQGNYSLSFNGKATIVPIASRAIVKSLTYNKKLNQTKATIEVLDADQLILSFQSTKGATKNIRFIRPGYPLETKEIFTKDFLEALKPFSVLRFMDLFAINGSEIKKWKDRAKISDTNQTSDKGIPIEYAIQLANISKKDIWINFPFLADDEYIRNTAQLLKSTLNPSIKVYLEHSNEIWNGAFKAYEQNREAALREGYKGPSSLNENGSDSNTKHWEWRLVARRLIEIRDIFEKEYGKELFISKVRPILASQVAYPEMLKHQLDFFKQMKREPKNTIYGIAGAPYFNIGRKAEALPDATKKQILLWLAEGVSKVIEDYFVPNPTWDGLDYDYNFPTLARKYNIKYLSYEGGPDTAGEQALAGKIEANVDPQMGNLVKKMLTKWFGCGGDVFLYFSLSGSQSKHGSWGIYENIAELSPKANAILEIANTPLNTLRVTPCP